MRGTLSSRMRAPGAGCILALGILWFLIVVVSGSAAEEQKSLLLLPIASGTPGQEWSAKALAGILEEGFGSLRPVRLVTGTAREIALRELAAGATVTPEAFRDICRRAGADLAVLGGSTLVGDRLALEIRIFDVGATRELQSFRGDEPLPRVFNLVEAAVRHVAAEAALRIAEPLFPRGVTVSLEAYAAYHAALLEEAPAARVEKLRGVLKLDANYAEPTLRLGVELFRQGSQEEALGVLERAVALGPKVGEARNNYGVALAAAGQPAQAQRQFEEAVSLAPDYAEARLNLARVFEERGRTSDAEKQYTTVLEADAGNDKARSGLAALYDRTSRPELAVREFRLLSVRRPDLAEAEFVRNGQEARKAREYARAEKFFLRATDINPQFAQAWAELGTNSYLDGAFPKSVEYFRKALTIDPGQAAYHYYLGLALDKGRQLDEALREFRRAVELGGPPEARLGLARAALESGDPGLAVEELNRLLVASPDHAEAKVLLAQATNEMETRRRLVEGQSQFANQRLARLEQIVADANRANRELEARLQSVVQEKRMLEKQAPRDRAAGQGGPEESLAVAPAPKPAPSAVTTGSVPADGAATADGVAREKAHATEPGRDLERLQGELAAERDARTRERADAQATLALLRADKDRAVQELAGERERLKREAEQFQTELAAGQLKKQEKERLLQELAAEKSRVAAAQSAREKADRAQAAEREAWSADVEKLKTELAAAQVRKQDRDRLAQELSTERAAREKAERAVAAEREEFRRQGAQTAARIEALETQVKTQAELLQAREGELTAARVREDSLAAQIAKGQAELQLLAERQAALEARAVADVRLLAEQSRALENGRVAVRDLALELGRNALRTQLWEKAQKYLEQAVAADPRSGEAWYGMGEALFQLGQYDKSRQMYDKAKQIY